MATGVAKTTYFSNAVLNVLRATNITAPANVYCALFTAVSDGEAGSVTEVSGGSYARQAITFGAPADNSPNGRKVSNSTDITFPVATANWGTITHIGIYDASTAGNLLYYGALTTSKTINNGDQFKITSGNLVVGED